MGFASGSPKMFEWPPPGGLSTRELLFSPIPLYKFVVVIFSVCSRVLSRESIVNELLDAWATRKTQMADERGN